MKMWMQFNVMPWTSLAVSRMVFHGGQATQPSAIANNLCVCVCVCVCVCAVCILLYQVFIIVDKQSIMITR